MFIKKGIVISGTGLDFQLILKILKIDFPKAFMRLTRGCQALYNILYLTKEIKVLIQV